MLAAGFVLTGGQSRRMGRDKALLPVGSQTLCEHLGDLMSSLVESVQLVGRPECYPNLKYPCFADKRPGFGPLSGLETALERGSELNLVVSCDVWNLKLSWLTQLLDRATAHVLCAVLEDKSGQIQPLCGLYRRDCGPIVSKAIDDGRLRVLDLLQALRPDIVHVDEIILNVNTPDEYDQVAHGLY